MKKIQIFIDGKELQLTSNTEAVNVIQGLNEDIKLGQNTIIVIGEVTGDILTDSGNVIICGNSSGSIETETGNVTVNGGANRIKTTSGMIISGANQGDLNFSDLFKPFDAFFNNNNNN